MRNPDGLRLMWSYDNGGYVLMHETPSKWYEAGTFTVSRDGKTAWMYSHETDETTEHAGLDALKADLGLRDYGDTQYPA